MVVEAAMPMEENVREEEETIHRKKRKRDDEDHQGETQQNMAKVESVVEVEVAFTPSWSNIIQPMEGCDHLEIL